MLKLAKYLSVLALTTSGIMAGEDFLQGLYTTSSQLQNKMGCHESGAISALGANLAIQSVASIIHPNEEDLVSEIASHTNASSDPEDLRVLISALRQHLSLGLYLYTDETTPAKAEGVAELKKTGAENIVVNFKDAANAVQIINSQVKSDTEGKIKELVTRDDIDPATVLGLLNTITVAAEWTGDFEDAYFCFNSGAKKKQVNGFTGTERIKSLETETATLFALPTRYKPFSLLIKLPKENQPITPIAYDDIAKLDTLGNKDYTKVMIPNVEISLMHDFKKQLLETLPSLLGEQAFSTTLFNQNILVSSFKQKAMVKWDKDGFEGAAATFMGGFEESCRSVPKPKKTIIVNRPFSFMFALNATKMNLTPIVIFSGQVASFDVLSIAN